MVRDKKGSVSKWTTQRLAKKPRRANGKIIKTLISKGQKWKKKLKKSKLQPLSPVHGSNDMITSEDNRPCLWKQVVSHHCRRRVEEEGDDRVCVFWKSQAFFLFWGWERELIGLFF